MKEEEIRPRQIFNEYLRLAKEDIIEYFSERDDFISIDCPACGKNGSSFQFDKAGFSYVQCQQCGTLYVNPRPSETAITNFYSNSESTRYWAEHFYKETEEQRRAKIFQPRATMIHDFFLKADIETFADIGAGYGTFLEEIKKAKIAREVLAIEPSSSLATVLRNKGFTVIQKNVEECNEILSNAIDLATSFELLEHVFSPKCFFEAVRNILAPDGYFVFTTLNIDGFDLQVLWSKSKSISPPHHLNFLNLNSAVLLLKRCGFETIKAFTPGKLDVDIVRNMAAESGGIGLDRFINKIIKSDDKIRGNFQSFLSESGLSSHMCLIAKKAVDYK